MSDHFAEAVFLTLQHEDGYSDDPNDPGGETNFGITKRSYPYINIRKLTLDKARHIYRRDFWEAPGYYGIEDCKLACKVFDLSVTMGTARATRLLQMAANLLGSKLAVDGIIGPNTLGAVNNFRYPDALLAALKYLAAGYYVSLEQPRYLTGWLNRLER